MVRRLWKLGWADRRIEEQEAKQIVSDAQQQLEVAEALDEIVLIAQTKASLAGAKEILKGTKDARAAANAALNKVEAKKEHGAMSQQLRQKVEQELDNLFLITRSSYHDGDMEGNSCRRLMRRSEEVMDAIEQLLHTVPMNQRAKGCDNEEVSKSCYAFKRLFQYMDALSHFCYQPYGTITDGQMKQIREVLLPRLDTLFRKLSRNTPPKVHMWQHLVEDLDRTRGLLKHHENKLEAQHQTGDRIAFQFRRFGAKKEKRVECEMRYQAQLEDPKVKAIQAEVHTNRSRKLGEKAKAEKELRDAKRKENRMLSIQQILDLPPIEEEFPSLLELSVIDRRMDLEEKRLAQQKKAASQSNS